MNIKIKKFDDLTVSELYKILNLRNEVFVVEQDCPYLDTDGNDQVAYHVMLWDDEVLAAYARIFEPGIKYTESSIGRVVVNLAHRELKLGHLLMEHAVKAVEDLYKTGKITISAQEHLQRFYNKHGFETVSEEYMEDDIPHVEMTRRREL